MNRQFVSGVLVPMLVLLLGVGLVYSQVLDRGGLTGTITDETGAALPGVTVTLTQSETGFTRVVITNDVGLYRAPLLPVGPYVIVAQLAGFATVTREGVVVTVGSAPVIDITMPLATVTEAITVTADTPVVETSRSVVSTTLNQKAIATLPIQGRDFRDFALLSPNAQVTPGLRSPIRFGGQQGDYSLLSVDGADMTNPFFAEYTGSLETKNFAISQEAVQEFQILTNGFNAEFGRSTGGVVNVVTKSGTNEWRGSGFLFLRDDALSGSDPFGNERESFSQQQFGGSIGGPIAQDRAFFFFAFDTQDRDDTIVTRWRRDASGVSIPEFGIADLGALEGQTPEKQDLKSFFGRVDIELTQNQRLTARLNFSDNDTNGFTGGRGQSVVSASPENWENFTNEAYSFVTSLTSVLGDRAFNELKYHYVSEIRPREALSDIPEHQVADTGEFGRRFFLPIRGDNHRHQITDSFSYLFGNHDVKFGVDWNSTELTNNSFIGFAAGTYFFNTLEDLIARQPSGLAQRFFINGFTPETHETDDYWQHELGFFIQDKWQVQPNLTVSYGVRYEAQWNNDAKNPIIGADGNPGVVRQEPDGAPRPIPQTIADDTNNFGPRIGISWDPTEDGKTAVRGSWGLYFGRTASIFMPTSGSGYQSAVTFLFPPPLPYPQLFPSIIAPGEEPPVPLPPPDNSFVADDFQNPRVMNVNLGVEREVVPNLSLGVDFIYSRTDNARVGGFLPFNMNTLPATGVDQYGRPVGIDFSFIDSDGDGVIFRKQDPNLGAANMMSSLGWARYKAITFSAKKAFSEGFQFQTHYTWSRDESNADTERDVDVFLGASQPFAEALEGDYGIDERDITHRFIFQGTWELGYGLTFSGIVNLRSGRAAPGYTFTDVNGDAATGTPGNHFDRPVVNGELLPRFSYRQPNFYNTDIRVMWSRTLGTAGSLDLLFELFNVFANDNFETSVFNVEATNFLAPTTFVGNQREAQIGIKFRFGGS